MLKTRAEIDWDSQPLEKISDVELAKQLGRSKTAVFHQRLKRGLPPVTKGRPPKYDWDNLPLGVLNDVEIAIFLKCSVAGVKNARKRKGIAKAPKYSSNEVKRTKCPTCGGRI